MTDTIDVLAKWADVILAAVNSWDIPPYQVDGCIRELATELRVTRESEKALEARIWDLQMAALANAKEHAALREKLAAQEPDDRPGCRCGDCALRVEAGPLAGECHFDPDPRPENAACEFLEERT